MELYIVESRADYLEVIDLEYPQYKFVLDEITFNTVDGELVVEVNKLSIVRSIQKKAEFEIPDHMEDEFLEEHSKVIIKELFDPVIKMTSH